MSVVKAASAIPSRSTARPPVKKSSLPSAVSQITHRGKELLRTGERFAVALSLLGGCSADALLVLLRPTIRQHPDAESIENQI